MKPHALKLLEALRRKVRIAEEEVGLAVALHEAWKPAAFDKDLHKRMGHSLASHTFILVRLALRRELVMALARLWGNASRELGMRSIRNCLRDTPVLDAILAEVEARRYAIDDQDKHEPEVLEALEAMEVRDRRTEAEFVRRAAEEAMGIITRYCEGGESADILQRLMRLRHEHLAHRQLERSHEEVDRVAKLEADLETFYSDMLALVRLLLLVVNAHNHDFQNTADVHRKHAALFWAGVRGERTEGHPNFEP